MSKFITVAEKSDHLKGVVSFEERERELQEKEKYYFLFIIFALSVFVFIVSCSLSEIIIFAPNSAYL